MFLGGCLVNVGRVIHICEVHEEVFCVVCFYIYLFFQSDVLEKDKGPCARVSCACPWCSACLDYQIFFLLNYNYLLLRPEYHLAYSKSHLAGES